MALEESADLSVVGAVVVGAVVVGAVVVGAVVVGAADEFLASAEPQETMSATRTVKNPTRGTRISATSFFLSDSELEASYVLVVDYSLGQTHDVK